jgi:hypothetical protein
LSKNASVVQRGALHHRQVQGGCAIFAFWINLDQSLRLGKYPDFTFERFQGI